MHQPVRGADDVHRRARPSAIRRVRPDEPAHRDHGRLAVPHRGHAPRDRPHAHGRGDHLLRHDRDLAGVHADARRRRARAPRRHRRARASARQVRIADPESGRTLPCGEPGELLTRGYSVMLGYWNDAERTAESIDSARWMHTGDLGTMDEQGYVKITGRIKDMVIRGGENLYPREIEEFLYGHDDVADVQVVGVPDERYGEELAAFVVLREGAACTEDDLRDWCRGKIAHHKVPRYIRFVDEFPMTVTGKVQKFKLRDAAIEDLGLQRAAEVATA